MNIFHLIIGLAWIGVLIYWTINYDSDKQNKQTIPSPPTQSYKKPKKESIVEDMILFNVVGGKSDDTIFDINS